jgi:predicted DCC family thiol-disulfide oxidoreductase YuxK
MVLRALAYLVLMGGATDSHKSRAEDASERPWRVLYDADCGFCMWLLSRLLRWDRTMSVEPIALQGPEGAELLSDLGPAERAASWHLISPTGERRSAGAALPLLLDQLPAGSLPAAAVARFPRLTERAYQWVAAHRRQLSRWIPPKSKERARRHVQEREHTGSTQSS